MVYQEKPRNYKIVLSLFILLVVAFFNLNVTLAKTNTTTPTKKTVTTKVVPKKKIVATKKPVMKKTVKAGKTVMSLKWSADGIKTIGSIAAFDYSYSIRNAVIKKIENYAKRNHIKVITAKVINSMNE